MLIIIKCSNIEYSIQYKNVKNSIVISFDNNRTINNLNILYNW